MVFIFSFLLIVGIFFGQFLDFAQIRGPLSFITSICLSYIMIEVGLEFSIEKRSLKSYGADFLIASAAAIFPAILCFGYLLIFVNSSWKGSLLSGFSSAPTSAGVLFSMMMAAGLGATWVFKKARVLAVLDDLVTILLLTPIIIIIHGFEWGSIIVLFLIGLFLFAAFRWQNVIKWPVGKKWLLIYAIFLTGIISFIKEKTNIHLEVLVPAFMWGCLLKPTVHKDTHRSKMLDLAIKGLFMLLVGLTFPKINMGEIFSMTTVGHVLVLTLLANIGKFSLVFCYKKEATLKERMALGVAMFPRGEVGAAVLLIGISYGFEGYQSTLAILSLALNLILTGVFIWIVMRLCKTGLTTN